MILNSANKLKSLVYGSNIGLLNKIKDNKDKSCPIEQSYYEVQETSLQTNNKIHENHKSVKKIMISSL